jgi:hypothetical protein
MIWVFLPWNKLARAIRGMLTGGDLLGSGVYGCVWMPPLDCKPDTVVTIPTNSSSAPMKKVDKLLSVRDATTEFKIAQRVHNIPDWERHFVVADTLCTPEPVTQQKEKDMDACEIVKGDDLSHLRILRMNFAGEALDTYEIKVNKFNFRNFVTSVLEDVALLTMHYICHMDFHSGNALLDEQQTARMIDWNLSIDVLNETNIEDRLYHSYTLKLTQESPDYLLINARYRKLMLEDSSISNDSKIVQDMLEQKPILKKQRAILGITKDEQEEGIQRYIKRSKSYQNGDMRTWFKAYWRFNDAWAVGAMIVGVISRLSMWPEYEFPPEFNGRKSLGYQVLKKLARTNPLERYDAVQALAELYPNNEVITKHAGAWLAALKSHGSNDESS